MASEDSGNITKEKTVLKKPLINGSPIKVGVQGLEVSSMSNCLHLCFDLSLNILIKFLVMKNQVYPS